MQQVRRVLLGTLCLSATCLGSPDKRADKQEPVRVKAKHANDPKREERNHARDLGLHWLARHQAADGHFGSADFTKSCPADDPCSGRGNPTNDVGVTGIALLAFLRSGSTLRGGLYVKNVKMGIKWLKENMNENGLIGEAQGTSYMYNHAIAAMAVVEAYGRSKYRALKKYAQRSIDYILKSRNPYKVWRYYPRDGDNDSSITGLMVLALGAAETYGLRIDKKALDYTRAWFEDVTNPNTGQVGYQKRGTGSSRDQDVAARFPVDKTEALTAIGVCCRLALGQTPKTEPIIELSVKTMLAKEPSWNESDGSIDLYYWYFGAMALCRLHHPKRVPWLAKLHRALLVHQRKAGHEVGSWPPIGPWGRSGGRIYATAMATMALNAR